MSKSQDNRVLSRRGARYLEEEEVNIVSGATATTEFCSFNPKTLSKDGDCD
jgi:hypothetical protein